MKKLLLAVFLIAPGLLAQSYDYKTKSWVTTGGCANKFAPKAAIKPVAKPSSFQPLRLEKENPQLIIMFTGQNCPYCDYMKPIMEAAKRRFGTKVKFLTIDVSVYPQYPNQYGFQTVPQIMYFEGGKRLEVHGSDNKNMTLNQVLAKISKHFKL